MGKKHGRAAVFLDRVFPLGIDASARVARAGLAGREVYALDAFRQPVPVFALGLCLRSLAGWCAGVLLLAALAAGSTWLLSARPWDRSLARLVDAGVIRIGYAVEPPYAFLRPDGEVSGQSPELAKRIVQKLGIAKIEWRVSDFGNLITELEEGRIDVIAAGMFITKERAQRVQFSSPIFRVHQALLVARGNPRQLHSYADALLRPGVKLATLAGSVETVLLERLGLPEAQRVLMPDAATGRVAVETGMVDGLALTSPAIDWMARHDRSGKTERAQPFAQELPAEFATLGFGGFAFRKEDRALVQAWNAEQLPLLRAREFQLLIEEFGFTMREVPGDVKLQDILR